MPNLHYEGNYEPRGSAILLTICFRIFVEMPRTIIAFPYGKKGQLCCFYPLFTFTFEKGDNCIVSVPMLHLHLKKGTNLHLHLERRRKGTIVLFLSLIYIYEAKYEPGGV